MAKIIEKIVQSKYPPKDANVLWDDGENLKIRRNGSFENVVSTIENNGTNLDIEVTVDNTTGNPSASATIENDTIKLTFSGLKGETGSQGNSGYQGAAGELEVVNNLTQGGATAALSAEQGKVLKEEITKLDQELNGLSWSASGNSASVDTSLYLYADRTYVLDITLSASVSILLGSKLWVSKSGLYEFTPSADGYLSIYRPSSESVNITIAYHGTIETGFNKLETKIELHRAEVNEQIRSYSPMDTTWSQGAMLADGTQNTSQYFYASDFISKADCAAVRLYTAGSTNNRLVVFYDNDKNVIDSKSITDYGIGDNTWHTFEIEFIKDAQYMRVTRVTNAAYVAEVAKVPSISIPAINESLSAMGNNLSNLESNVDNINLSLSDNMVDVDTTYQNGCYINSSGGISSSPYAMCSDFVELDDNLLYCIKSYPSSSWYVGYYSEANENSFISVQRFPETVSYEVNIVLKIPANANFVRVTKAVSGDSCFFTFGVNLIDVFSLKKQVENINERVSGLEPEKAEVYYVKKDGSGDFAGIHQAFKALAQNENPKILYIEGGEYDVLEEMGGQSFIDSIPSDVSSSQWTEYSNYVPDNTKIIGLGEVFINFLPNENISAAKKAVICPIALRGNIELNNVTIKASNCRYAIHDESSTDAKYDNAIKKYVNVKAFNLGGGYLAAYGSGHGKNSTLIFENCLFKALDLPWATHDNRNDDNTTIVLSNCAFITNGQTSIRFGTLNARSGVKNVQINNCYLSSRIQLQDSESLTNRYSLAIIKSETPEIISDSGMNDFEPLIVG